MGFKNDAQRRAMFANISAGNIHGGNKFSHGAQIVYVQPQVEQPCVQAQVRERVMDPHTVVGPMGEKIPVVLQGSELVDGPQLAERKQSGFEILGQAGEKLADGVTGVWPGQSGAGDRDGYESTNAVSGLWPGDDPNENLDDLLSNMVTSLYPDSSEGRVVDDRHYYVDVVDENRGQTRNHFSYAPIYATGDLPLMAVDGIGTAGATAVSMVPLMTMLGAGYVGASLALKGKNKLEAEYRKGKKK